MRRQTLLIHTIAAFGWAFVSSRPATATPFLSIDFGNSAGSGAVQSGFQNYTPSTSASSAALALATPADVTSGTTTVALTTSAGNFRNIDRATSGTYTLGSSAYANLYRDAVLPNDGATLIIDITGLTNAQQYTLDFQSYDAQPISRSTTFTPTVGTGSSAVTIPSPSTPAPNAPPDDTAELLLTPVNGEIKVVESSTSTVPFLNGLEISATPEPASLGLLSLGSLALLARRRRIA
jgi:hypothetical protein